MGWILVAVAVLAIFFLAVMASDCNRFVIREYECHSDKLKKGMKVVLLSDLHSKEFGRENEKLFQAIKRLEPDMVWIAGDMYTSVRGESTKTAEALIRKLAMLCPVYYGNGNHEQKTRIYPKEYGGIYEAYRKNVEKAGVCHLVNESIVLPEFNMEIFGSEIGREYYGKFKKISMKEGELEKLLGKPDKERFNVLIAHNPDYFEAYADWGADLTVSGHVHGGLMRLPFLGGVISPALRLFPKYDGGEFHKGGAAMILSRGLGTHTLPVRIFNPGELVVIHCRAGFDGRNEA